MRRLIVLLLFMPFASMAQDCLGGFGFDLYLSKKSSAPNDFSRIDTSQFRFSFVMRAGQRVTYSYHDLTDSWHAINIYRDKNVLFGLRSVCGEITEFTITIGDDSMRVVISHQPGLEDGFNFKRLNFKKGNYELVCDFDPRREPDIPVMNKFLKKIR